MKPDTLRAVFFDVDGVLLDSLPQHLAFCAEKARQYGLFELQMPTVAVFKRMVKHGISVSPMLNFFLAVGFPPPLAKRGVEEYEREFSRGHRPEPFPGIEAMLGRLRSAGIALGLVTSNTRANVEPALSAVMPYFDPACLFYYDRQEQSQDKAWCLAEGSRILQLEASQSVYVGDQPADAVAAQAAGWHFLGVSYGWGFEVGEQSLPMAASVPAIAEQLLAD